MSKYSHLRFLLITIMIASVLSGSCQNSATSKGNSSSAAKNSDSTNDRFISQPLVKHIYTADPSAHVFNGRIYIIDAGIPEKDDGSHFDMRDYPYTYYGQY